jgi:hypothetical protein
MRTIMTGLILLASLVFSAEGAQAAPWCANYSGGGSGAGGGSNCGFYSFEQCMATLWGNGGFCDRNPFERSNALVSEPRRRRHRRNH